MKLKIYTEEKLKTISYLFEPTVLCEIMGRNGSDKGSADLMGGHNYTTLYYKLFNDMRNDALNIFELGLGTNNVDVPSNMGSEGVPGASIYGWAEFFQNANVYGADIDDRVLFSDERIKTFYCDQTDPESIKNLWSQPELESLQFDIIVEDGLHATSAQICFFENSIHKLKDGGFYVIEDFNHGKAFERLCGHFKGYEESGAYPNLTVGIYQLPPLAPRLIKNKNNGLVIIQKNQ